MTYAPISAFRRPVEAVQMDRLRRDAAPLPDQSRDKWDVLRDLGTARKRLGLTDRSVTVLQALLSFHPGSDLDPAGPLTVFPSNAAISARLNGMASSTMRRHLGHLVEAGLIARRDSPNGKRFRRAGLCFGFDLGPLVRRAAELSALAAEVTAAVERRKTLRLRLSVMRRDLAALAEYGAGQAPADPLWTRAALLADTAARLVRQQLPVAALEALERVLLSALDHLRDRLDAADPGTSDSQNGQHQQRSEKEDPDLRRAGAGGTDATPTARPVHPPSGPSCEEDRDENRAALPDRRASVPLGLLLASCHAFRDFFPDRPRHWHDVVALADRIRPMLGITPDGWDEARQLMGPEDAAATLLALLDRFDSLRNPGGYLRHLCKQSAAGRYSVLRFVTASPASVHSCELGRGAGGSQL